MVSGKRSPTTAAMALVCAVTVLGAPGAAFAATTAPTDPTPSSSSPAPVSAKDLEEVRRKLEKLYHDAAVATDAYNAAEEETEAQSARIAELARAIATGQARLDGLKDRAGAAARAQYRTGGLPDEARLALSEDPEAFLDGAERTRRGQRATKDLLDELARAQEDLRQYSRDASAQWRRLEADRKAKAEAKKEVKKQIAAARELESQLEEEEKERLAKLEREAARKAQAAWLDSGVLDGAAGEASTRGEKAVAYAMAQTGKPYEWGAEGPRAYDCSGLTSQAWAAAGLVIPRTSQEQWRRLPRVDVEDMRPGDLVIYNSDASHVAMYIGEGSMVHAPRPGRTVTVAGAGSMPILGVVRPDK
ncbi:C40 family peptidase [Streptomyces minutiscleroticus]|uniref:C40 family peptidase n=1 Tax=Streptomyces minutiscleroticus TaxID=68238 RepID=UPI003317CC96